MDSKDTTLIYFSPTKTTRTILEEIAKGLGKNDYTVIDITNPGIRTQPAPVFENDLVLIGAPVYAGRLQKDAADYFKTIKASNSRAVLVVLYGNREFEDALLEMKNICVDAGFIPLAGGAFIGEHSFSDDTLSIAQNRPDTDDLERAFLFGKQIAELLKDIETGEDIIPVHVPGNFPYKEGMADMSVPFIRVIDACDDCGICVESCPNNAIDEANAYATIEENCIFCCACIKSCPQDARIMKDGPFKDKAKWLFENCAQRKEPELFLPGE